MNVGIFILLVWVDVAGIGLSNFVKFVTPPFSLHGSSLLLPLGNVALRFII